MKHFGILVLLVHVVVELFSSADARFILSSEEHDAVLKSAEDELHMPPSFKELPANVDTKPVAPPNCTCYRQKGGVTECDCFAYVNDPSSGIKGKFTFITVYLREDVIVGLLLNKKLVVAWIAEIGRSDTYTVAACNQSEVTKGKSVCLVMDGHRSKATKQVTECAHIESPPLYVNLGCFSFTGQHVNEEIQRDGSLKLVDAKQKITSHD